MEAYSKEFRRDVLAACDAEEGTRSVALRFNVSESWVRRIKQERREQGKIAPLSTRRRRKIWEPYAEWLLAKLDERPDIYLRELQAAARAELGWEVSDVTLSRACRALRRTRKKKTRPPTEQQREDVIEARRQWAAAQLNLDPDRVVFIDETWAKTNMTRTYGRSPRGQRLVERVPYGRWETTTFLGAMRSTGFVAPLCVEGAINGALFQAWVEQHLTKVLRPGDIVVMDNLSSHKGSGVAAAIEAVGAEVRYLPPYSPDLNPIELAFSKFKKLLRDGAERTNEKLWRLCGQVLDLFTETECRNYIAHCGYRYN
jgi:transposase